MAATVDSAYPQEMYSQGMMPMNISSQHPGAVSYDPNMYANQCYGQAQYGGDYPTYGYSMVPPGSSGNEGYAQEGMAGQPYIIDSGSVPRSFILPKPATGNIPDTAMQNFQNAVGGNYCFYDNTYAGTSMMPQGFISGYEQMIAGEPKKAVKKLPTKKESNVTTRKPKAKTLFPCC